MTYSTTITEKGQITIPKEIRDILELDTTKKVLMDFDKKKREVKIKPAEDLLEFAKKIRVKNRMDPVKAREYMEKHYERV